MPNIAMIHFEMAEEKDDIDDMADFLVVLIVLAMVGGAIAYIVKQKKKGAYILT